MGPENRFKVLHKRFDEAIIVAAFAENTTSTGGTLNLFLNFILNTSVFQTQNEEWHILPVNKRNLPNVLEWWDKKCRMMDKFTKLRTDGCVARSMDVNQQATKAAIQQRDQVIQFQQLALQAFRPSSSLGSSIGCI